MEIIIRKGRRSDIPEVLELVKELAEYEKAPLEVTNTVTDMERDAFGENPVFFLMVAEKNNAIIGIAIYFIKYSTWKGRGIYLDDIVVRLEYRRQGIGTLLFDAVIEDCRMHKVNQLHWQVLEWNEPAISFYRKYNASFDSEWINCKLTAEQINNIGG
jgi:GNAT superfamily N-acetyltransferase